MRKLITLIFFYLLGLSPLLGQNFLGNKVVILDDCAKWEESHRFNGPPGLFFIYKNQFINEDHDYVLLTTTRHEDPPYRVFSIRLSDIKEKDKTLSSELSYMDWVKIDEENDTIIIIHPDDFCSGRRFVYGNVFKAYEARISAPEPTTECVIETIIDPMEFFRIDSSRVRRRENN